MTAEEIGKSVNAICKKAGILVGQLADPQNFEHLVYEAARFHISHLVGVDAIHNNSDWHCDGLYQTALNQLDKEISKAKAEASRRA